QGAVDGRERVAAGPGPGEPELAHPRPDGSAEGVPGVEASGNWHRVGRQAPGDGDAVDRGGGVVSQQHADGGLQWVLGAATPEGRVVDWGEGVELSGVAD